MNAKRIILATGILFSAFALSLPAALQVPSDAPANGLRSPQPTKRDAVRAPVHHEERMVATSGCTNWVCGSGVGRNEEFEYFHDSCWSSSPYYWDSVWIESGQDVDCYSGTLSASDPQGITIGTHQGLFNDTWFSTIRQAALAELGNEEGTVAVVFEPWKFNLSVCPGDTSWRPWIALVCPGCNELSGMVDFAYAEASANGECACMDFWTSPGQNFKIGVGSKVEAEGVKTFTLKMQWLEGGQPSCGDPDAPLADCRDGRCCTGFAQNAEQGHPDPPCQPTKGFECCYAFFPGQECPCTGACCSATASSCTMIEDVIAVCQSPNTFLGWNSVCELDCVLGACCSSDGTCTMTEQAGCQGSDQVFRGLGVSCDEIYCNDDCTTPTVIDANSLSSVIPFNISIDNSPSRSLDTSPSSCAASSSRDLWYKYEDQEVPPLYGRLEIATCGTYATSGVDTSITVYASYPVGCDNCTDDGMMCCGNTCYRELHYFVAGYNPRDEHRDELACNDDCNAYSGWSSSASDFSTQASCLGDDQNGYGATLDACTCVELTDHFNLLIRVSSVSGASGDVHVTLKRTDADWGVLAGTCGSELGACCTAAACSDSMTELGCIESDGFSWHLNQTCAQVACGITRGACCRPPNGSCAENWTEAQCVSEGGAWVANGVCPNDACTPSSVADNCLDIGAQQILSLATGVVCKSASNTYAKDDEDTTQADHATFRDAQSCEVLPPRKNVWYRIQTPATWTTPKWVEATTCDTLATTCGSTNFDTMMQVFCEDVNLQGVHSAWNAPCKRLVCLGGNDDDLGPYDSMCDPTGVGQNRGSTFRWCAEEDKKYFINLGGFGGAFGTYELSVVEQGDCTGSFEECEATGSCCVGGQCLSETTYSDCNGQNGTWERYLECAERACGGACCVNGFCDSHITRKEDCSGTWYDGDSIKKCTVPPNEAPFNCNHCGNEGDPEAVYGEECEPPNVGDCDANCHLIPESSCLGATGNCCTVHVEPGCHSTSQPNCCADVCAQDDYCCSTSWDEVCVERARDLCNDVCLTGACCRTDGQCTAGQSVDQCSTPPPGTFLGYGTTCSGSPSPCATGACCNSADSSCTNTTAGSCASGLFQGLGTQCSNIVCSPPANDVCGQNMSPLSLPDTEPDTEIAYLRSAKDDLQVIDCMIDADPDAIIASPHHAVWYTLTTSTPTLVRLACVSGTNVRSNIHVYCDGVDFGCDNPVCIAGASFDAGCDSSDYFEWCADGPATYRIAIGSQSDGLLPDNSNVSFSVSDDFSSCEPLDCTLVLSACCIDGACQDKTQAQCFLAGGIIVGSSCTPEICDPPDNDACTVGLPSYELTFDSNGDLEDQPGGPINNRLATVSFGSDDPAYSCPAADSPSGPSHSLWFKFAPSADRVVSFDTCSTPDDFDSAEDTVLELFTRPGLCSVSNNTTCLCDDDCPLGPPQESCEAETIGDCSKLVPVLSCTKNDSLGNCPVACSDDDCPGSSRHASVCGQVFAGRDYWLRVSSNPASRPGKIQIRGKLALEGDLTCGGACCFGLDEGGTAHCQETRNEAECTRWDGFYYGLSTTCISRDCPEEGACCDPQQGTCTETIPQACAGLFHGEGTDCQRDLGCESDTDSECPKCPPVNDLCKEDGEFEPFEALLYPSDFPRTLDNTWATTSTVQDRDFTERLDPVFECRNGGPDRGFGTMWYKIEVPQMSAGTGILRAIGGDPLLALYFGASCGSLKLVACSDDSCGFEPRIELPKGLCVTSTTPCTTDTDCPTGESCDLSYPKTYYLEVASYAQEDMGLITLQASEGDGFLKSRFLSFVPNPIYGAIRVTLVQLHKVEPPYSGAPTIPYSSFEGQYLWVGPPSTFIESNASITPFKSSKLQCTPNYQDWSTVGLLHVRGSAVVPSSLYRVASLAGACEGTESSCMYTSCEFDVRTARWGDVEAPYNPPEPIAQPDLADVGAMVNKFRGAPGAPIKARVIIQSDDAFGNITDDAMNVDFGFSHISACVNAFRGQAYPAKMGKCAISHCALAPNPVCTTNADCTGAGNSCLHVACTVASDCAAGANGPCDLYCQ